MLDAGGLALCVWLFVFEGELVCAWFEGVVVWLDSWLVWAWLVELFEDGACAVPVPELDGWPAAFCPVDGGDWVWAEFVEGVEGLVCADPDDELDEGVDVEDGGDEESCCRWVVVGLELDELGELGD